MIYSHKPQRSGRGITSNTNNPPQDPPPPHEEKQIPTSFEKQPEIITPVPEITVSEKIKPEHIKKIQDVPDVPIEDTTPPVPEICPEEKSVLPKSSATKVPKPKITVTTEIKTKKQSTTEPKISWFRRLISSIKKFFRR